MEILIFMIIKQVSKKNKEFYTLDYFSTNYFYTLQYYQMSMQEKIYANYWYINNEINLFLVWNS